MTDMSDEKVEAELQGNTLRVYWSILKSRDGVGVREIQRAMDFSSPTLAAYHLNKLCEIGLVEQKKGKYYLAKIVKVGMLDQFVKVRFLLFPRHIFYVTVFASLLALYLLRLEQLSFYSVYALVFGALGTCIFLYETLRIWRKKP